MLALHLSCGPDRFSPVLCRNVDQDGHYLYLPAYTEAAAYLRTDWAHEVDRRPEDECPTYGYATGKSRLPPYAAEILAAQLAHRRAAGSGTRGHLFADFKDPYSPASDASCPR